MKKKYTNTKTKNTHHKYEHIQDEAIHLKGSLSLYVPQHWSLTRGLNRLKTFGLCGGEKQWVRNTAKTRSFRVLCLKTKKTENQSA